VSAVVDVVAVDWSGAKVQQGRHLWLARVSGGSMLELRNGRSREEVVADLVALRHTCPDGLAVGLDFAFSFPAWFLRSRGYHQVDNLWHAVADEGEEWLARCEPPFWGRPRRRRPDLPEHFRRAELRCSASGIHPKSVFQIGGAGTVGTGSLRGMPYLPELRSAGFSIWPFDPPSSSTVVEIYPRLLTGAVHKRNAADRAAYLERATWSIGADTAQSMIESEDAFDAGISALAMADHRAQLTHMRRTTDPITRLEGDIWPPPDNTT
jgi:hypothetical protein